MKTLFLPLLCVPGILFCPPNARAATLNLDGRIEGLFTPSNPDLSTLDYYFITALSETQINAAMMVGESPSPLTTGLDMRFYIPPDSDGDVIGYANVHENAPANFTLLKGDYIIAFVPGNSDFDGYWPLPPYENNDSEFNFFDYHATISGDVRLNQIWIGQPNGTFKVTTVAEPATAITLLLGGLIVSCRRRRTGGARWSSLRFNQ